MRTWTGVSEGQRWTSNGEWINIGGDRNWRNNNPGNLEAGEFARRHGAIGTDGRFAIFPDYPTGRNALISLLKTETYQSLTIAAAIERFAPGIENDVLSYMRFICKECNLTLHVVLSAMSAAELDGLAAAIEKFEGTRRGITCSVDDQCAPEVVLRIQQLLNAQRISTK